MKGQETIDKTLDRVIKDTYFTHRGVLITRLIGGWEALGKKFTKWNELNNAIDETLTSISQAIKKGQQ